MPISTSRTPSLIAGVATLTMGAALAMPAVASADEVSEPNRIVLNDDSLTASTGWRGTAITFTRPAEYDYCVSPHVYTGSWDTAPYGDVDRVYPLKGDTSGRFIVTQEEYDEAAGGAFSEHFIAETFTITLPLKAGDYSATGYCVSDQATDEETEVDFVSHFTVAPFSSFGSLSFLFGSLDLS